MIEAPQSQDSRPSTTGVPPNGASKASMMIAAYRAARLNQHLNLRATPLPQQDQVPSTTLDGEVDGPSPTVSVAAPPVQQTAPPQAFVETNQPVMSDPNELTQTEALTAQDPFAEVAVALSRPKPLFTPAEPAILAPVEPLIAHAQPAAVTSPARTAPALAEIGLGPCMLLRLNQIGFRSVQDVAQAKPDDLRAALGSSSRLLNVEAWISNARYLAATGCAA